jgi:hypothetical protein
MTMADGRALRAEGHDWRHHLGFNLAWSLVVLLAALGRLTRWALREGWYRPHVGLAVAMSSLVTWWTSPLAGAVTFAALTVGWLAWRVNRFGVASGASSPRSVTPTLFYLSRAVYRTWRLGRRWRQLGATFIKVGHGLTGDPPRLREWRHHSRVRSACVVNVSNANQHIVDDLAGRMPILAQTLGLHSAAIEPVRGRPGLARLTCYWGSRLEERQPITVLPEPEPGYAFFGLGEDEQPAGIRLDLSALFTGESRSGKSTAMWACILSALEQWEDGGDPVEFWVIDLAITEFADAKPLTQDDRFVGNFDGFRYATTQPQANALLGLLQREADRRARIMLDQSLRKLRPSEEMPRIVLVIDEMLRLIETKGDKVAAKNGGEATGKLRQILTQYAKFGITVWAGTQASKIEVLTSVRDWFQQRVAFSTSTPQMTDCALEQGAAGNGATCHQFSPHRDAGRGFMKRDGYSGYFPFRGVWVDDEHTRVIGQGDIPDEVRTARGRPTARVEQQEREPGAVYIFKDARGRVLYVGKTKALRPSDRWLDHLGGTDAQMWSEEVRTIHVIAEREDGSPMSHRDAILMERDRVRALNPKYNNIRFITKTPYEMELEGADR